MNIKAIPTTYNYIRYRSRTEAQAAQLFDLLHIPFLYEQEGFDINDTWYLPDFYLPEAKQFVEVKGIITDESQFKLRARKSLVTPQPIKTECTSQQTTGLGIKKYSGLF